MKVTLTVHGKERDGEKFEFTEPGTLLFGRSEKAQCRIRNDKYVSRSHFLLLINPPEVRLRNLSKANGTEVDGVLYRQDTHTDEGSEAQTAVKGEEDEPVEAILRDGSEIEAGYTRITVAIEAAAYCTKCSSPIHMRPQEGEPSVEDYLCAPCRKARWKKQWHPPEKPQQAPLPPAPRPGVGRNGLPRPSARPQDRMVALILQRLGLSRPQGVIPSILGYEVHRIVDEGAMGIVFEATRCLDDRHVAIKVIKPQYAVRPNAKKRFLRETCITRALRHTHIIEFIDGGEANGLFWFAMEYVPRGYDILKHMKSCGGRIPQAEALRLMLQALDGLAFAHREKAVVHRDLKPPNILLVSANGDYVAKITDFGIAKSLEDTGLNGSSLTSGGIMGTIGYMPPEQVTDVRNVTLASDVFAMGATLYHMLTGELNRDYPRGNQNEAIRQVVDLPVIPIRERDRSIAGSLACVIEKSMNLEPEARYPSAMEFKAAIEAAMR